MTCTPPEAIVTFANFKPCESAATGTTWYLTDTRPAGGNNETYKVRKMPDNRIWMIQDIKFGNCNRRLGIQPGSIGLDVIDSVYTGHYGNCCLNPTPGAGYSYDWPAAMNSANAFTNSTVSSMGCSGAAAGTVSPNPGACQGICPDGWHIPTIQEIINMYNASASLYKCSDVNCFAENSAWEGIRGGYIDSNVLNGGGNVGDYCSSEYYDQGGRIILSYSGTSTYSWNMYRWKHMGTSVRCVRNY
jgi:uncharacterized protein (TIGR02145 family)